MAWAGGAVRVVLAGGASGRGVSPLSFLSRLVTRRGAAGRRGLGWVGGWVMWGGSCAVVVCAVAAGLL